MDEGLLKLAAKAMGAHIWWDGKWCHVETKYDTISSDWNPIESNADAFVLGVKSGVFCYPGFDSKLFIALRSKNQLAATRLAIFNAAVEIGRCM